MDVVVHDPNHPSLESLTCLPIWNHFSDHAKEVVLAQDWWTVKDSETGGMMVNGRMTYPRVILPVEYSIGGVEVQREEACFCPLGLAIYTDRIHMESWTTVPQSILGEGSPRFNLQTTPGSRGVAHYLTGKRQPYVTYDGANVEALETWNAIEAQAKSFIIPWDRGYIDADVLPRTLCTTEDQQNGNTETQSAPATSE